jgi:SAM-dependent methyltransferase
LSIQSGPAGAPKAAVTSRYACKICCYETSTPEPSDLGTVRGNTERFFGTSFRLWKCPRCLSIHNVDPVDFQDIYKDYPLNNRRLDIFARGTLGNLLKRIERAGLSKADSILDFGSGNGIFVQYLKERGYARVSGYDPYTPEFSKPPTGEQYDCVVANDVIEHVADPRVTVEECVTLVKPGGILYLGTADSEPVDVSMPQKHLMRLHQPFHRVIITQESLIKLGTQSGLTLMRAYRRSYMDTLLPFSNYRFLDEFNRALGHNMDLALHPSSGKVVMRRPSLFFYALFGYFFPSAYEPAVVLRKPG